MNNTTKTTIGCDLGDKYSHACVLDEAGRIELTGRIRTTVAGFRKWFTGRAPAIIAIEVGTHSRWVKSELEKMGHTVLVANAREVRLIYGGKRKNDRLDAEKLARLCRADPQLLCPIQHRSAVAQAELMVLRSRDQLVQVRTELINHVRGVSKSFGLRIASCESSTFPRRAREVVPEELQASMEPVLETIELLTRQIKGYEAKIAQMAKEHSEVQAVLTINGVGALTAMAFILTLEDPMRFSRSRDVGPYLGLVPKERQTGHSDPQLRITKAGDGFVRKLLVNCAQHILGPHGKDSNLRRYGMRLKERGGKNAKKRAVIAVTRKLAVLMHRLWVSGEVYDPLYGQAATAVQA